MAFAVQAPGEDAVFGVRFTARRPLRTWMDLTTADKDLGLPLGDRAHEARPRRQSEREVLHLDRAHGRRRRPARSAIVDDAFAALARGALLRGIRPWRVPSLPPRPSHSSAARCGSDRIERRIPDGDNLPRFVCAACGAIHYQNPKIVVGCLPGMGGPRAAVPARDRAAARTLDASRRLSRERRDR